MWIRRVKLKQRNNGRRTHLHPWVRFPYFTLPVGLVCCWFSSLLRGSTPGPLIFLSPQKPIFQYAIRPIKLEKKSDLVECSFLNSILLLLRLWNIDRIVLKKFLHPRSSFCYFSLASLNKRVRQDMFPFPELFISYCIQVSPLFSPQIQSIYSLLYSYHTLFHNLCIFIGLRDHSISIAWGGRGGPGRGRGEVPRSFLRGVSRGFRGNGEEISLRKGVYRKLTAMRGGEGVIIILQSLRGDQVNFIVTAKILRPPPHPRR